MERTTRICKTICWLQLVNNRILWEKLFYSFKLISSILSYIYILPVYLKSYMYCVSMKGDQTAPMSSLNFIYKSQDSFLMTLIFSYILVPHLIESLFINNEIVLDFLMSEWHHDLNSLVISQSLSVMTH